MNTFNVSRVGGDLKFKTRMSLVSKIPIVRYRKNPDVFYILEWDRYRSPSSQQFIYLNKIPTVSLYIKLQVLYIIQWISFLLGYLILCDVWDFLCFIPKYIKSSKQSEEDYSK